MHLQLTWARKQTVINKQHSSSQTEQMHYFTAHKAKIIWASLWENQPFAYAKTKTQISCSVTAQLIIAFVFAIRVVQSLYFLNPKFQASSHLLRLCSPVCVGSGQKTPKTSFLTTRLICSWREPYLFSTVKEWIKMIDIKAFWERFWNDSDFMLHPSATCSNSHQKNRYGVYLMIIEW